MIDYSCPHCGKESYEHDRDGKVYPVAKKCGDCKKYFFLYSDGSTKIAKPRKVNKPQPQKKPEVKKNNSTPSADKMELSNTDRLTMERIKTEIRYKNIKKGKGITAEEVNKRAEKQFKREKVTAPLFNILLILLILFLLAGVVSCASFTLSPHKPTPTTAEQKAYEYTLDDKEKDLYDRLYGNPYDD